MSTIYVQLFRGDYGADDTVHAAYTTFDDATRAKIAEDYARMRHPKSDKRRAETLARLSWEADRWSGEGWLLVDPKKWTGISVVSVELIDPL